jgi:hypothetical protein
VRIYQTKTIPAYIRQKEGSKLPYGTKTRQLTVDDFEIVPEHEEQQLMECQCEICGAVADKFHWESGIQGNSTLLAIEIETYDARHGSETRTEDFLGKGWYEVCELCMRSKIVPYLQTLRRQPPVPILPEIPATSEHEITRSISQQLIGLEEELGTPEVLEPLEEMRDGDPF